MNDRMSELERRVAALEEGAAHTSAAAGPPTHEDASTLWVLDGLRQQAGGSGAVVYAGTFQGPGGVAEWQYGHRVDDLLGAPDDLGAAAQVVDLAPAAARLAALGHPARLAILAAVLRGHDRTAELPGLLDLGTTGQVYHHVKALTAAGWLRPAARGRVAVPAERAIPLLVAIGAST